MILKGNVIYSKTPQELEIVENGYIVYADGVVKGVYAELPEEYANDEIEDYGDKLIIPGLVDTHIHAPQYAFRGLGMDMELLDWLNTNTFPEESKMKDIEYAKKSYGTFVENLKNSATTRAVVFGTIHRPATLLLMDMLEESGLATMVGKVNMDRNSPEYLCETAEESAEETVAWLEDVIARGYKNTQPILTPRFTPSVTDELMAKLKEIQVKYDLPMQSHLSENLGEIAWVKELCPWSTCYGDAYDHFGMFGNECKTIMAHCVHSTDEEVELMKNNGVFIAHCPESNINLSSGVAPIRRYLELGMNVGLGSDVAAGSTENMFTAMAYAVQASKMRWRLLDDSLKQLTADEVFYLATKGGGAFFGKVGSFEEGYEMDAVVLDDSRLEHPQDLDVKSRLERMIYFSDDREICAKYVKGTKIYTNEK
ncbi:MAG: amidohydrolase family protein [Ruminococcus sp.]|nr:amidohydrolase family protein [Ruminococcus sp.]